MLIGMTSLLITDQGSVSPVRNPCQISTSQALSQGCINQLLASDHAYICKAYHYFPCVSVSWSQLSWGKLRLEMTGLLNFRFRNHPRKESRCMKLTELGRWGPVVRLQSEQGTNILSNFSSYRIDVEHARKHGAQLQLQVAMWECVRVPGMGPYLQFEVVLVMITLKDETHKLAFDLKFPSFFEAKQGPASDAVVMRIEKVCCMFHR